jgi:hypothetical protein
MVELIEIVNSSSDLIGSWFILDNARIHGIQEVKDICVDSGLTGIFITLLLHA